jgi:hypothetical protein
MPERWRMRLLVAAMMASLERRETTAKDLEIGRLHDRGAR